MPAYSKMPSKKHKNVFTFPSPAYNKRAVCAAAKKSVGKNKTAMRVFKKLRIKIFGSTPG